MNRRLVDSERDYVTLLEMHRRSWIINFPGEPFYEDAFRVSLRSDVRQGQVYAYEDDEGLIGWLWLDIDPRRRAAHISTSGGRSPLARLSPPDRGGRHRLAVHAGCAS
jgi:hypothetical protein